MNVMCDGCQRGLPTTQLGMHHTETELFMCTRARYRMELEPKERDWLKSERKAGPFTFDGGEA